MDRTNAYSILFPLLRSALWGHAGENVPAPAPSDTEWEHVYEEAVRQTVTGLAFEGLRYVPDEYMPGESILAKWAASAEKVERSNRRVNDTLAVVCRTLNLENLTPVLLKGQGIAWLYGNPLSRECGDIDLYFPDMAEWKKAVGILGKGFMMRTARDGSAVCNRNGVIIEIHRTMFDMQPRKHGSILGDVVRNEGFDTLPLFDGLRILTPSPVINLLMLNLHILRHALCFGIGLRQLCDYAVVYSHVSNTDSRAVGRMKGTIERLGLNRWNRLLESFISSYLGVNTGKISETYCSPLFEIVSRGGNFGFHTPGSRRSFGTVIYNNIKLFRFAPMQSAVTMGNLFTRRLGV